jgi:hypothetical protein
MAEPCAIAVGATASLTPKAGAEIETPHSTAAANATRTIKAGATTVNRSGFM